LKQASAKTNNIVHMFDRNILINLASVLWVGVRVGVMVFNATLNTISVISWRTV